MSTLSLVVGIVLGVGGIAALLATLSVSQRRKLLLDDQQAEITLLKGRCDRLEVDLAEQDRKCAEEIAELRGRLSAATGDFARELVIEVVKAARETP